MALALIGIIYGALVGDLYIIEINVRRIGRVKPHLSVDFIRFVSRSIRLH